MPTPYHVPLSKGPKGGHSFSCHRGCVDGVLVDGVHCAYGHTEPGTDVEFGVTGRIEAARVDTGCGRRSQEERTARGASVLARTLQPDRGEPDRLFAFATQV